MPLFPLCLFALWMFENQSSIKNHLNESENELFTVGNIDVWTFSNGLCSILSQFLNCRVTYQNLSGSNKAGTGCFWSLQDLLWLPGSVLRLPEQAGCSFHEKTDGAHAIPHQTVRLQHTRTQTYISCCCGF